MLQGWIYCVCLDHVSNACWTPWSRACGVLPGSAGAMDPSGQVLSRGQPCILQSLYPQEGLLEWFMANPGAPQSRLGSSHVPNVLFQWWPPDLCLDSGLHPCSQWMGEKVVSCQGNGGQEWAAVTVRAVSQLQSCLQGHLRKRVLRSVWWTRWIFLVRDTWSDSQMPE